MKLSLKGLLCLITTVFLSFTLALPGHAADSVFNIAKGQANALHNNIVNNSPANSGLVIMLFQAAEADATLQDYDDAATLIAAAGNTEATFTNYARKVLTDADLSLATIDDSANNQWADAPDQVWTSAGGALNNTLVKVIFFYDPDTTSGTDSELIPLSQMDFSATTNGNNLTANWGSTGYFIAN